MPTSDAPGTSPQNKGAKVGAPWRKALVSALVVLVLAIVADVCLCLALEPYAGSTELMWSEYRRSADVDTVFVGPSTTGYGLSPQAFDEVLGSRSFNMGTPGQALHDSLASVRTAVADHHIRRAVLCVGYETILEYPYVNSSVVYTQAKCVGESPLEVLGDVWNLVGYDYYFERMYSLSCAFPWTYDHVALTLEDVGANLWRRAHCDTVEAAARYAQASGDEGWHYWGQGYDGYELVFSATHEHGTIFASHLGAPVIEATTDALRDLCAYCRDAGVELYVVGAPYVPSVLLDYGDAYWQGMTLVRQIVTEEGAHFFDLNMAHRDVYAPDLSHFFNQVHLNHTGAEVAGATVATLIADIEQGKDVSGRFYEYSDQGWQEYLASIPYVDSVDYASTTMEDGNLLVDAQARTGTDVPVAYKLEVLDEQTGSWQLVRDWGEEGAFVFAPVGVSGSSVRVRVSCRSTNGQQDQDRMVEGPV